MCLCSYAPYETYGFFYVQRCRNEDAVELPVPRAASREDKFSLLDCAEPRKEINGWSSGQHAARAECRGNKSPCPMVPLAAHVSQESLCDVKYESIVFPMK